eukprot:gene8700-6291_t
MQKWVQALRAMGKDPPVYLLNNNTGERRSYGGERPEGAPAKGKRVDHADVRRLFKERPAGRTPTPEVILRCIEDHRAEAADRPLLLLILTDGEANNMRFQGGTGGSRTTHTSSNKVLCHGCVFFLSHQNVVLDAVQNQHFGDVQVCLMGLSLVRAQHPTHPQLPHTTLRKPWLYGHDARGPSRLVAAGCWATREDIEWFENEECEDTERGGVSQIRNT